MGFVIIAIILFIVSTSIAYGFEDILFPGRSEMDMPLWLATLLISLFWPIMIPLIIIGLLVWVLVLYIKRIRGIK